MNMTKPNIKIFVCYHKNVPSFSNEYLIPIHVGKNNSLVDLKMIGDNTGENISSKNESWCELTALYWMWKNIKADYYGLFHYRRFLNFNKIGGGYDLFNKFDEDTIETFGWNEEKIQKICSQYDILTAPIWNIHPVGLPNYLMSNYDFYARDHYKKDLDIVLKIIKNKTPEIYPFVLKSIYSKQSFFANMMIMKKEYFNEYCDWLFDILFEAEEVIDITGYDSYQKRIWGFIAERLSNCFLEYLKFKYKNLKYDTLGMAYGIFDKNNYSLNEINNNIKNNQNISKKLLTNDTINIVFAIDDNYAKHCAGAIQSILENSNEKQKFKFFIICDNSLSKKIRQLLSEFSTENIAIEFLQINTNDFAFYPLNRDHISIVTYYRLAIHKIIPKDVSKVIYLDSDLVVVDNISQLWNIEFDDNYLAGSLDEGGITQIRRLGLPLSHNYINAGICVMNLEKMRNINLDHLYTETFYKNMDLITLQDQDILNLAFCNKIKKLDCRWNVQSRFYGQNELEYAYTENEARNAALNPAIIHFSDRVKPWQSRSKHVLKQYYSDYQSLLKPAWSQQKIKQNYHEMISYDKVGANQWELNIFFNNKHYEYTFKGKFGRRLGKYLFVIIRKIFKKLN